MQFRTVVKIPKPKFELNHEDAIMSLGSCFSDNIANKFSDFKFNILSNPFGVLYNPISISQSLNRIISGQNYSDDEIHSFNNTYFSYDYHSSFNSIDKTEILNNINVSIKRSHLFFQKLSTMIITFGTAYVYQLKENYNIVANCHKVPSNNFIRKLLTPEEIANEYQVLLDEIFKSKPSLNIIITISPVRHLRDSAHENQISKSHLFTALNMIKKRYNQVYYFPSFEIMMDELRDYRFYADDMIHPSKIAEEYIFESFINHLLDNGSKEFLKKYKTVFNAKQHRLMTKDKDAITVFKKSMLEKIRTLQSNFSNITLDDDINYFNSLS